MILNALIERLRGDIEGAKLLADWLGEGGHPVSQMRADHRAYACNHGNKDHPCPYNTAPNWWDKFKSAIATTIRAELELKNHLELKAQEEDRLAMCSVCGCCLKLKVWTPLNHIKAHTPAETIGRAPVYCWMRTESE